MAGRKQDEPVGESAAAIELVRLLRRVTSGLTVRELAERYEGMGGKTTWAEYRKGTRLPPRHVVRYLIEHRVRDAQSRTHLLKQADELYGRIERGEGLPPVEPAPVMPEPVGAEPTPTADTTPATATAPAPNTRASRRCWALPLGAVVLALATVGAILVHANSPHTPTTATSPAPEARPPRTGTPFPRGGAADRLYAVAPDHSAVLARDGGADWTVVGGRVGTLHTGRGELLATDPDTHAVFRYEGAAGSWTNIGTPGADFAVGDSCVYALAPDRGTVLRWDEHPGTPWRRIGGPAGHLYANGGDLFATGPDDTGGLFHYDTADDTWTHVSAPAAAFAVDDHALYRLAADRGSVWQWSGAGETWTRIGGPATALYVGGAGLFATDPATHRITRYGGTPGAWTPIGEAGADLAIGDHALYRLAADRGSVWQWSGAGETWTRIGGPAAAIATAR
ncbi:hypothetical protein [Kitasatospora sp. NPDC089509]|uniref:hypothetical protein n=1 Tax=Kitasatospora sp. NPDC089509 TaxID=3364079 RepID=UPI00380BB8B1